MNWKSAFTYYLLNLVGIIYVLVAIFLVVFTSGTGRFSNFTLDNKPFSPLWIVGMFLVLAGINLLAGWRLRKYADKRLAYLCCASGFLVGAGQSLILAIPIGVALGSEGSDALIVLTVVFIFLFSSAFVLLYADRSATASGKDWGLKDGV